MKNATSIILSLALLAASMPFLGAQLEYAPQPKSIELAKGWGISKEYLKVKDNQDLRFSAYTGKKALGEKLMMGLTFNKLTGFGTREAAIADKLLALGSDPGLGIRALHAQGITGKGVAVAIIDQHLAGGHPEYSGRIALYEDMGCERPRGEGSMHGPGVASLLVGKNVGTAPEADLYYFAAPSWTGDAAYYARALERIMEINAGLAPEKRIRAVSVSASPSGVGSPFTKNGALWDAAMAKAAKADILVLDCSEENGFVNPGYCDLSAPDDFREFKLGFPQGRWKMRESQDIYAPSSRRTVAEEYATGEFSYQYCGVGGLSWAIPYVAGVSALAWQANPGISAAGMRALLLEAAYVEKSGAKIVDAPRTVGLARERR